MRAQGIISQPQVEIGWMTSVIKDREEINENNTWIRLNDARRNEK